MSEIELEIVARHREGHSRRRIARELGVGRARVDRVLREQLRRRDEGAPHPGLPRPTAPRPAALDAHLPRLRELLARHPAITAVRMHEELRADGYAGCYSSVRDMLRKLRPRPAPTPVVRFETGPGEQAQMDYATHDIEFAAEGRRRVHLFSYLLCWSRRQYLRFVESQDFETTIREHVRAFRHLGGAAATCLYDNMRTVVDRWEHDRPVYNTRFLAFATHYGFRPSACRPRRPQTKGKVERPFAYVESSLLNAREFRSLEHLNEVTRDWLSSHADVRVHRTTGRRPVDAHAEELPRLLAPPAQDYDTAKVVYRMVSAEGRVAYGGNEFSAPWRLIGLMLPVRVTDERLWIYDERLGLVAEHPLPSAAEHGRVLERPEHLPPRDRRERLAELARRYAELGAAGAAFLEGLLRTRRYGAREAGQALLLLRHYRRADQLAALERAVRFHAWSADALERILAAQAAPRSPLAELPEELRDLLRRLGGEAPTRPRPTADYQGLLDGGEELRGAPTDHDGTTTGTRRNDDDATRQDERPDERNGGDGRDGPGADPVAPGDAADPAGP